MVERAAKDETGVVKVAAAMGAKAVMAGEKVVVMEAEAREVASAAWVAARAVVVRVAARVAVKVVVVAVVEVEVARAAAAMVGAAMGAVVMAAMEVETAVQVVTAERVALKVAVALMVALVIRQMAIAKRSHRSPALREHCRAALLQQSDAGDG